MYEKLYNRLSSMTGLSNEEVDLFILNLVKILTNELHRSGKTTLPYMGKFFLKRLPPRKREVKDFVTEERHIIEIPARDMLKFTVNKKFKELFR